VLVMVTTAGFRTARKPRPVRLGGLVVRFPHFVRSSAYVARLRRTGRPFHTVSC